MSKRITTNEIMKTSYQLFVERGYDAVTVQDICQACNITKPTFYNHLKSKEDIIANFYDKIISSIINKFAQIIETNNYWDKLMICFDTLVEETMKIGSDLVGQMFIMNLKEDRNSFNFRENLTDISVAIIKRAQEKGQIRNQNDPELLFRAAAYTYLGYELTWSMKKGDFDWKNRLHKSLEVMFDVIPDLRIK